MASRYDLTSVKLIYVQEGGFLVNVKAMWLFSLMTDMSLYFYSRNINLEGLIWLRL
jgi:hypothetical protein